MALTSFDHAIFGRPAIAGYGFHKNNQFKRLGVLDGAARYRLTAPIKTITLSVGWTMDDQTLGGFRYWWENDINHGADWFLIELMLGTGRDGHKFDVTNTFKTYEAHFQGPPQYDLVGYNYWTVTAALELRTSVDYPLDPDSPEVIQFSDLTDGESAFPQDAQRFFYDASNLRYVNKTVYSSASGDDPAPAVGDYPALFAAPGPLLVENLAVACDDGGSGTASGLIVPAGGGAGTVMPGIDTIAFDGVDRDFQATASNIMAEGDSLIFRLLSEAGAANLAFRFKVKHIAP